MGKAEKSGCVWKVERNDSERRRGGGGGVNAVKAEAVELSHSD